MFSPQKSDKNFLILTFLWIKTNVAYTRLEVIAKQPSALQVEFITGVKLICYFVLYNCFLHWAHPPNMAVGDLDFYYTLYLWLNALTLPYCLKEHGPIVSTVFKLLKILVSQGGSYFSYNLRQILQLRSVLFEIMNENVSSYDNHN